LHILEVAWAVLNEIVHSNEAIIARPVFNLINNELSYTPKGAIRRPGHLPPVTPKLTQVLSSA
jgi:hypothetical protein